MTKYTPATPQTDAIVRPLCKTCGTKVFLIRIEPDKPGHDLRTFQCPECGQIETTVVKFGSVL
jgi:predicted RNA-binding Zn-ribbon protein involved in translation (DUF1610 family)